MPQCTPETDYGQVEIYSGVPGYVQSRWTAVALVLALVTPFCWGQSEVEKHILPKEPKTFKTGIESVDETLWNIERFRLFNRCRPMRLIVQIREFKTFDEHPTVPSRSRSIPALTEDRVRERVKGMLRRGHLQTDLKVGTDVHHRATAGTILMVRVDIQIPDRVFIVRMEYSKVFTDVITDRVGTATTWETREFGLHQDSSNLVMDAVTRQALKFIMEYRSVNEEDCSPL